MHMYICMQGCIGLVAQSCSIFWSLVFEVDELSNGRGKGVGHDSAHPVAGELPAASEH